MILSETEIAYILGPHCNHDGIHIRSQWLLSLQAYLFHVMKMIASIFGLGLYPLSGWISSGNRPNNRSFSVTVEDLTFEADFKIQAQRSEGVHAFVTHWTCEFTHCHTRTGFDTSPAAPYTHWKVRSGRVILSRPTLRTVRTGLIIECNI